jgi:hypothetical protein
MRLLWLLPLVGLYGSHYWFGVSWAYTRFYVHLIPLDGELHVSRNTHGRPRVVYLSSGAGAGAGAGADAAAGAGGAGATGSAAPRM